MQIEKEPLFTITKFHMLKNSARSRLVKDVYQFSSSDVYYKIKLGQGSYGTVYGVVHRITGVTRAIKMIQKSQIKYKERLVNEVESMYELDHPHIVRLFECFEDTDNIYMVLELCEGGDVFDKVLELGNFSEDQGQSIFVQMMRAIQHYSYLNIVHRDLKPENFLFKRRDDISTLNMIDFGLAQKYYQGDKKMETKAGTAYYVAPEVLEGCYDQKCDIWSVGVILYVLLCGYPPFYGENEKEILQQIQQGDFQFDGTEWDSVSMKAKELICNMITRADVRYSVEEVMKHEWVNEYIINERKQKHQLIEKVFTVQKVTRFLQYPIFKQISLFYLATQLDENLLRGIRQAFLILEKTQTGVITYNNVMEQLKIAKNKQEEFIGSLQQIDFSHSKGITYSMFIAICLEPIIYLDQPKLKQIFFYFQSETQPYITPQSLTEILFDQKNINDAERNLISQIMQEIDMKKDGKIDITEFTNVMRQNC